MFVIPLLYDQPELEEEKRRGNVGQDWIGRRMTKCKYGRNIKFKFKVDDGL